ncbi:ABC transporter ATP-binding protein/permease [bacterium]|nr:ABC transporter ATP-binding protein/permease [bacterium]MBP9810539.1 ABC transporter ATP-binding protein/permease [bacterium]
METENKTSIFSSSLWLSVLALAKPFFHSREKSEVTIPLIGIKFVVQTRIKAWSLVVLLVIFLIGVSKMNAMINGAYGNFQNALPDAAKDGSLADVAWSNLWVLAKIFIFAAPVVVFYAWLRSLLGIVWRQWLTEDILKQYFSNRNYYRISNASLVENPDERIANDVDGFVTGAVTLVLSVLDAMVTLFFFTQILWGLSGSLTAISILYATFGSLISIWLSVKLIGLKYNQTRLEADYRFGLINVRNNVEPIAFYQGEQAEWKQLLKRFHAAIKNNLSLIGYQRQVSLFTTWFDYFVAIVPFAVILPVYLRGDLQIGAFTQANMAFGQVLAALSLFVSQIGTISTFAANVKRVTGLLDAVNSEDLADSDGHTAIVTTFADQIALADVTVKTPDYKRLLVEDLTLQVPSGTGIIIKGPSGSGKSSILRAIAGLWRSGDGTITRPQLSAVMFLSQSPYMSLGGLRDQLLYPNVTTDLTDKDLIAALNQANVGFLATRYPGGLDGYPGEGQSDGQGHPAIRPWSSELSPGEQQRLAFARFLLAKPKYVFLDEATSALGIADEELLYRTLQASGATYVSVGHRPSLDAYHQQSLTLLGEGRWELSAS